MSNFVFIVFIVFDLMIKIFDKPSRLGKPLKVWIEKK